MCLLEASTLGTPLPRRHHLPRHLCGRCQQQQAPCHSRVWRTRLQQGLGCRASGCTARLRRLGSGPWLAAAAGHLGPGQQAAAGAAVLQPCPTLRCQSSQQCRTPARSTCRRGVCQATYQGPTSCTRASTAQRRLRGTHLRHRRRRAGMLRRQLQQLRTTLAGARWRNC